MMFVIDLKKFCMACANQCEPVTKVIKKAGCSTLVLNRIYKGRPVQVATLGKISKALQCEPSDLLA